MYQLKDFKFSSKFKFGVADADLQVIGEQYTLKYEKSEPTMWLDFSKKSPLVYKNQTTLMGIDRYHRYKEDVDLMKGAGIKHFRTSISMARTLTRDKKPNKKALDWYKKYFSYLNKNGIKIYATIYHWELPQFLSEKGGWKNRETISYLVEHAKVVHKYLGEYIDEYFILNEPFQSTLTSYYLGEQAPGETDIKGGLATVHNILLAQGLIFRALKDMDPTVKLSVAYNTATTYAATNSPKDVKAARYAFDFVTAIFTDPVFLGKYPDTIYERFADKMPTVEKGDMDIIKIGKELHAFGVNYYKARTIKYKKNSETKFEEIIYQPGIKNVMGRPVYVPPIYPEGLYDVLCELYHRYESHGLKRMYITENGGSWPDERRSDGTIDDEFRRFYLYSHLKQIQKAILKGVPLEAYFQWTFMDNFNWCAGYRPESIYGLVHVDFKTMKRTPKTSYFWYKDLIKTGILSNK